MTDPDLAAALRRRADWLHKKSSSSHLENPWADVKNVVATLLEIADVIDSVNGVYMGKEELEEYNSRIRYGGTDKNGVYHEPHPDAGNYNYNDHMPGQIPWTDRKKVKKPVDLL